MSWDYPFSEEDLKKWKELYREVNAIKIGEDYYAYKPLSVDELRQLQLEEIQLIRELSQQSMDEDEKLLRVQNRYIEATAVKCILWPVDFKDKIKSLPCGILERLNAEIFKISGYDESLTEPIKL